MLVLSGENSSCANLTGLPEVASSVAALQARVEGFHSLYLGQLRMLVAHDPMLDRYVIAATLLSGFADA